MMILHSGLLFVPPCIIHVSLYAAGRRELYDVLNCIKLCGVCHSLHLLARCNAYCGSDQATVNHMEKKLRCTQ